MYPATYTELLLVLILLLLSGFFASSEVVFFSQGKGLIYRFSESKVFKVLKKLLKEPKELLISILLGNEIINVLLSSYLTLIFGKGSGFISSLLIFIFGETLPKNLVLPLTERLVPLYTLLFYPFHLILTPLRFVFYKPLERLFKDLKTQSLDKEQLLGLLTSLLEEGNLEEEEYLRVSRALNLDKVVLREVMTPRPDVVAFDEERKVSEVLPGILKSKSTKFLLYRESQDNVTGYLELRDLLPLEESKGKRLSEFKREVLRLPEFLSLEEFLKRIKGRDFFAVLLDEHGDLSGVITSENLLNYFFNVKTHGNEDNFITLPANVSLEDFSQRFSLELPEDYEYDTLGGLVMAKLGRIPKVGDEVEYKNLRIRVKEVEGSRIKTLLIIRKLQS